MSKTTYYLRSLLLQLKRFREEAGITTSELERRLILGPGWITRFESGASKPSIDTLVVILSALGRNLSDLVKDLPKLSVTHEIERKIYAEKESKDILVRFKYGKYDSVYKLSNTTTKKFDSVIRKLRNGLSRLQSVNQQSGEAIKTDSVANAFLKAVKMWPHVNPSDIWWFVIYRAYCDPFNHPAIFASLDFSQSWKRTGGWALEEVLVRHYAPFLKRSGINLFIAPFATKERFMNELEVRERLEADKVDILLTGKKGRVEQCFGVVHVKSSFAERRTDDIPMSKALVEAGYTSPLWTMDCKSTPSKIPKNSGELGVKFVESDDRRSAKRKDIEDDGYFSACFSYNTNTIPTPKGQKAKASIYVCDFKNPDDQFARFIISRWRTFLKA